MNFLVFSQLAGKLVFSETGSLETASSCGESAANLTSLTVTLAAGSRAGLTRSGASDSKFKSYCDRRLAIEPRPRLLELRGQSKQRRLVSVARDKLNRDR
jgi:hypothetical protein